MPYKVYYNFNGEVETAYVALPIDDIFKQYGETKTFLIETIDGEVIWRLDDKNRGSVGRKKKQTSKK